MLSLRRLMFGLAALRHRGDKERELEEELRFHVEEDTDEREAEGLSAHDAALAARKQLGNMTFIKESTRESWGWSGFERLLQDVRYGCRLMLKNRTGSIVIFASLTLGIGATTAIFSLQNTIILRPLPGVQNAEGLVRLSGGSSFSFPQFESLKGHRIFANTVAVTDDRFQVEIGGSPRIANSLLVSGDYFTSLGVNAAIGRTISSHDEKTQALVAVLDYGFWTRAYSANPAVIGQSILVNRVPLAIIGITPPAFKGVIVGRPNDFTVPISIYPRLRPERPLILTSRSAHWLSMMGRLQPGQMFEQARAQLQVAWPQILAATAPPGTPSTSNFFRRRIEMEPGANGFSPLRRSYVSPLYVLMALVGLVLLVACANVANLLTARGAARHHEFVIRQSLGAGRGRLIRQLLTESLVLAALSGFAGCLLARWMVRYLVSFISSGSNPISLDFSLDARVLAFSAAVTILSALFFGLAPALRGSRIDFATGLKEGARSVGGGSRLRKVLVVAQIALSMTLVVGSGLFLSSLQHLLAVDTGLSSANVLLVKAEVVMAGYRDDGVAQFFTGLRERVSGIPGVELTGLAWAPPVSQGFGNNGPISAEGGPPLSGQDRVAWSNFVSPQYFDTVGQRLLAGRDFTDQDRRNSPGVAILNQTMARHFFGDENPIGRRIDTRGGTSFDCEVVGVVRDAIHFDVKEAPQRVFYVPYTQGPDFLNGENMILAVRSSVAPRAAINQIRDAVSEIDPHVLTEIEALETHVAGTFARERLLAILSGFLGGLSVLLVAIGLYGVMAWSVTRRTAEIGVRIALGARSGSVVYMVLRESMMLVALGMAFGVFLSSVLSRFVGTLLFGVTPRDAVAFIGAAGVMTIIATVATLLPAIRAARTDPLVALRYE